MGLGALLLHGDAIERGLHRAVGDLERLDRNTLQAIATAKATANFHVLAGLQGTVLAGKSWRHCATFWRTDQLRHENHPPAAC